MLKATFRGEARVFCLDKQEGEIKDKTFVEWAMQSLPIIRKMGTVFEAFAHRTFIANI